MIFQDRVDAGRQLARRLVHFADRSDVVVLGIPRGGLVVANEVAAALHAPLDVFLSRKLGVPGRNELAFGAVAADGVQFINAETVRASGITTAQVDEIAEEARGELDRRAALYRGDRTALSLMGKTAILIDDGVATGASLYAAIQALQLLRPAKLVLAVPVAPESTWSWLGREVDESHCVVLPKSFDAVGKFYQDFTQTDDAEVLVLLQTARRREATFERDATASRLAGVVRRWAHPMRGDDSDYDALLAMIGDARVVLLGEATHGTQEFYRERARITQRLICEKNFQAVALEADWPDAFRLDRHVHGDSTDALQALAGFQGFPEWMWRNPEMLQFVEWLRLHNDALETKKRVSMFGLDLYCQRASMQHVLAYLEATDPDAAKRAQARYSSFEAFGGDRQSHGFSAGLGIERSSEDEVVEELIELQRNALRQTHIVGLAGIEHFFETRQPALMVRDAEEYYRAMLLRTVSSWNLRDRHMMDTLNALIRYLDWQQQPSKLIVWTHNSHAGDARATQMGHAGGWNLGQLARQAFGRSCRTIGFTTYSGTVTAASEWGGSAQRMPLQPARADSYEGVFHATNIPAFTVCMTERSEVGFELRGSMLERAIGAVYRPASELSNHYVLASLSHQFDAVIHVDETHALETIEHSGDQPPPPVP